MNVATILKTMDYGPALESRKEADQWLRANGRHFGPFINGKFSKSKSAKTFITRNPATAEKLATITQCGSREVNAAVKAARKAQSGWAALGGHGRAKIMYAIARLVQKHARIFAVLETLDNGKPIRESRDIDIPLVVRHFYHHAGWAQLFESEYPEHQAHGVVGQIIPWNFPLLMLAWKIAPALATGNTVILKPAEFTSLTALRFAELCQEAGVPDGVVNIVTGDGACGELIVGHTDIDKIAFTGSTDVGRLIRQQTAGTGKRLSLELGGKSPFIIFEDADIDSAIEGVVDAIWFNQGQVCCAGSRLLVQEGISERVIKKLKSRMKKLRVGDPLDKCIDMGAIIDKSQHQRICKLVQQGIDEGAILWQSEQPVPDKGCFYPPTLMLDVEPSMTVFQEEIFGPVLVVSTFRTPEDAVALANNTRYGLAASVWSENINLALDMAPAIKAGVVWINCTNQFDAAVGFGGYRESGFGREGGREGLTEYMAGVTETRSQKITAQAKPKSALTQSPVIDQTAKFYIGGKQARADGGYSLPVLNPDGLSIGLVGDGNRKDIRNAVEAASKAHAWSKTTGHNRAQILYYIAENLASRAEEFCERICSMTGISKDDSYREVEASISRLFTYGAWADKFEGTVHSPPLRGVALVMNEPVGIIGIACPDQVPLLGLVSLMAPAIAMGNRVVVIPSQSHPLSATDFYQVLETSDVPGGVVNIITGNSSGLIKVLAEHDQVDGVWSFGSADDSKAVELASAHTLKRSWVNYGQQQDWFDVSQSEGRLFLSQATEVKNIWIPYGE